MQAAPHRLDQWPRVIGHLSSLLDLAASARAHRALVRKRGVRSAADLLHLALLYGPGGLSLRGVASFATEAGIADLCDVSLLDRLRNSGDFLADVLAHLMGDLVARRPAVAIGLSLVDGSTVSRPGSDGSDWRLHARYEPACGGFTDLVVTEARTAEALCCVAVRPGDVMVHDRGYARVRNFAHARANGADFLTRIGWCSLKLFDVAGQSFDLLAALPESGAPVVEYQVRIGSARSRDGGAADHRAQATRRDRAPAGTAAPHGQSQGPQDRSAHPANRRVHDAADVVVGGACDAPRRWSGLPHALADRAGIPSALKSLGGFAELRASDPRLARSWLLAHLIAAVLVETSLGEALDSPP